jgi:AraC-like DNA-binding protein
MKWEMQPTHAPLIEALKRVEFWLERDGASRVIVAASSLRELQRQNPRGSLNVTPRKLRGPRKPVRGRRHYQQQHLRMARWPNDGMDENVLPYICCVISGQADFRIADYVLHCKVGDWVFVPAGVPKQDGTMPHLEGDPTGRQCDVLWIYTDGSREQGVQCWICHSKGDEHFENPGESCWVGNRFLAQFFSGFCDEIQGRNSPEVVAHLLRGILVLTRTEIADNNVISDGLKQVVEPGTSRDPIEEAKTYVTANIWRQLTIQNVARRVLVSPSTLTRYFRERTGQTFIEYLNEQRVQLAGELLRETDLPISIVSAKVGLKYGQLRVLIQKKFHCSPGELRAMKGKVK